MAFAWSGTQNLTASNEPGVDYELGARFVANADITVSQVRIYQPAYATAGAPVSNRRARIWSSGGAELAVVVLPNLLPEGWSLHDLPAPMDIVAGTVFWVSYTAERHYGFTPGGFPRNSADGSVTVNQGAFNGTPGQFPTNTGTNFYGVEFAYEVTVGPDDTPPGVTASAVTDDRTVTVTFSADSDLPVTWRVDWGDGSVSTNTATGVSHTYAADGLYAILVTATDTVDLSGHDALAVEAYLPPEPGDLHPTTDLVAAAFLGGLPGVPAGKVATTLPQDASSWAASGFVQVYGVGGDPERHVALRRPVVTVDCWANAGQSGKPPWGKANQLAEIVLAAVMGMDNFPMTLTGLPAAYAHARVLTAFAVTEPRRITNDPGSYARYTFDLEIHWIELP